MQIQPKGCNPYINIEKISNQQTRNPFLSSAACTDSFCYDGSKNKSSVRQEYEKIKEQQGLIGKTWDGIKNFFRMKSGSKQLEKTIKEYEKGEITSEEAQKALEKYKEGQKICVDVIADMASGIFAVGAFALAIPTGGASLAIGIGAAGLLGAGIKTGIKAGDAILTGKEYSGKDLLYDIATGTINGIFAPVTNGLGNCVTKTIAKKLGLEVLENGVKQGAKQIAKQGIKQSIKSAILTKTVDVAGGTIGKRAIALGTGMAIDGALSGASDSMVKAALEGDDIIKAGVQGAAGGLIMAPIIGGGFRLASKAGKALNNKITTKILLPEGTDTKFRQGTTGDCALLSTIDGMMNNPSTSGKIKEAITKTAGGDYHVKIGDTIVDVAKSSLSDEALADTTGIKIFEQAYKQLTGDIDGGFAEVASKQFGLNPIHIPQESLSDELIDKLSKEQGNIVLSFGALVDTDGAISSAGNQRHYFTIKQIDADSRIITLTSPTDTSKTIKLSYDEAKSLALSIDGGSIIKTDLPYESRSASDKVFYGKKSKPAAKNVKCESISDKIGCTKEELTQALESIKSGKKSVCTEEIEATIQALGISFEDFGNLVKHFRNTQNLPLDQAMANAVKILNIYQNIAAHPAFSAFKLSITDAESIYECINNWDADGIYKILSGINPGIAKAMQDNNALECTILDQLNNVISSPMPMVSPDNILELTINGKQKRIIFPDAPTLTKPSNSAINPEDLIKSNMITQEIADAIDTIDTASAKIRIKPNIRNADVKFDIDGISPLVILQKAKTQGVDTLSSQEVHILTDIFETMYKTDKKFASTVAQIIEKNKKSINVIYAYIEFMRNVAEKELQGSRLSIEPHAFMRMLDRNMVSVTDYKNSTMLDFKQFIQLLKKEVTSTGKKSIPGYYGPNGINLILRNGEKGKIIIDSIM